MKTDYIFATDAVESLRAAGASDDRLAHEVLSAACAKQRVQAVGGRVTLFEFGLEGRRVELPPVQIDHIEWSAIQIVQGFAPDWPSFYGDVKGSADWDVGEFRLSRGSGTSHGEITTIWQSVMFNRIGVEALAARVEAMSLHQSQLSHSTAPATEPEIKAWCKINGKAAGRTNQKMGWAYFRECFPGGCRGLHDRFMACWNIAHDNPSRGRPRKYPD